MKVLSLISLCFILLLSGCQQNTKKNTGITTVEDEKQIFENEFLKFAYPLDWKITEDQILDESAYSLSVEKKGFDSSGLVTIVITNELLDQDYFLEEYLDQMDSNKLIQNLSYKNTVSSKFNSYETKSITYSFEVLGLEHSGIAKAFNKKSSSILYIEQEADEDHEKNKEGFDVINKSFRLKL